MSPLIFSLAAGFGLWLWRRFRFCHASAGERVWVVGVAVAAMLAPALALPVSETEPFVQAGLTGASGYLLPGIGGWVLRAVGRGIHHHTDRASRAVAPYVLPVLAVLTLIAYGSVNPDGAMNIVRAIVGPALVIGSVLLIFFAFFPQSKKKKKKK